MTREQSSVNFTHLFTQVFPLADIANITSALDNDGIDNLVEFINCSPDDFPSMEYPTTVEASTFTKLSRKELRLLKNIHAWSLHLYQEKADCDWTALTLDDYDAYRANLCKAPASTNPPASTASPTTVASQATHTLSFLSNVKLDLKTFPTFDGKKEHWLKFKRGVLSIAYTHGLQPVLMLIHHHLKNQIQATQPTLLKTPLFTPCG